MSPMALVFSGVTLFVGSGAEGFLMHSIFQDGANSTDNSRLQVDVVSGSVHFDAVDASRYASLQPPVIVVAF